MSVKSEAAISGAVGWSSKWTSSNARLAGAGQYQNRSALRLLSMVFNGFYLLKRHGSSAVSSFFRSDVNRGGGEPGGLNHAAGRLRWVFLSAGSGQLVFGSTASERPRF